jgi:hypothetical protein
MPDACIASARSRTWTYVAMLAAASALSRLPQLLSPNLLVDGDESIVGLMARHLAGGREFPLFFWGQHYGLSTIEAMAAASTFIVFGSGPIALKASMLALWTVGVVFLFLTCAKLVGSRRAFWIALVFVAMPAWAVWSMKARGGYITAFTAAAALLWLCVQDRERQTPLLWVVAGVLTWLIYLAQPLWLPGLVPILLATLISRRSWACALAWTAAIIGMALLIRTTADAASPPMGNLDVPGSVPLMARQIYALLTGAHEYFWTDDPPGVATVVAAALWCSVVAATAMVQVIRLAAKQYCRWSHLLFLSICCTLGSQLVLMHSRDARYLLPLPAFLVMLAAIDLADFVDRNRVPGKFAAGIAAAFLVLGSVSMIEFRSFSPMWPNAPTSLSESKRMEHLFAYLGVEDARHVFSMNGLLQSQLAFYSGEKIVARWSAFDERHQPYVDEVDRALAAGERVAVVGYTNTSGAPGCWDLPICTGGIERLVLNPEQIFTVDGKYFAYVGADRELLERLHFRFPD